MLLVLVTVYTHTNFYIFLYVVFVFKTWQNVELLQFIFENEQSAKNLPHQRKLNSMELFLAMLIISGFIFRSTWDREARFFIISLYLGCFLKC